MKNFEAAILFRNFSREVFEAAQAVAVMVQMPSDATCDLRGLFNGVGLLAAIDHLFAQLRTKAREILLEWSDCPAQKIFI